MIDPTCLFHGMKMSEHLCLYCCLCYTPLTPETCNTLPSGKKEDVCIPCANEEENPIWAELANLESLQEEEGYDQ